MARPLIDSEHLNFEIVKWNQRTGRTITVDVVKGESAADARVRHFQRKQSAEEKEEGWSFYRIRTTDQVWFAPSKKSPYKVSRDER
jgi:hypothetical protein